MITDASLLEVALCNVMDNAVNYADEGGTIFLAAGVDSNRAKVRVANTGCRLSQKKAEELCNRFRRGDEARSVTGVHCGLGLSLVDSIVDILGGEVRIRVRDGGTYEIALFLPLRKETTMRTASSY